MLALPPPVAIHYGVSMRNGIPARLGRVLFVAIICWLLPSARSAAALTATPDPTANADEAGVGRFGVGRFGVIESYEDPAAADRLGVAWTRVRFQWAEVQPDGPDDWRPPLDDDALDMELDAGREVVGLLIGIPEWARDRRGLPRGLDRPFDDPGNAWAVFVGEAVSRYAGRIDRWIIWNEPDIDDADAPGHTWDGNIEDFAQLQRVAYLAARAANPKAVIHLGAFTYFWQPDYFHRFLSALDADPQAAANDYYFDVATAHLYFQPNAVYNVLFAFHKVLAAHGLDKPIWLVETNAPPMDDPYWTVPNWTLAVTLNEQAAFVPQAIAAALSAGAERIAVYKLKDTPDDRAANPEPFGLLRWDNSRRPAFDTYRVAIRLLDGVTAAERERWDAVAQVRLAQPGQTTTVLFARLPGPQTARVRATAATAELVDMWGQTETIVARGGYFTVRLPGALCVQTIADYCMIGGTTYYLIQAVDAGAGTATAASTPRPPATPQPTRAATPTRSPSATPEPTATIAPAAVVAAATARPTATAQATAVADIAAEVPAGAPTPAGPAGYAGLVAISAGVLLALALAYRAVGGRRRVS